jgi:hypothetical protein
MNLNAVSITAVRERRSNVAVAYSTKDRVDLTLHTFPALLETNDIDIYWFDGSRTDTGKSLPLSFLRNTSRICEVHHNVIGGPDSAIIYALQTLKDKGYEWVILVENDIMLHRGWLSSIISADELATADGFNVGAASCRIYKTRVLSVNDGYSLLFNSGAGIIALKSVGVHIILRNYRTTNSLELARHFQYLTGHDISKTWELPPLESNIKHLSADWFFDLSLYMNGYVVAAPVTTFAHNIDPGHEEFSQYLVREPYDHFGSLNNACSNGTSIRRPDLYAIKSLPSPVSNLPTLPIQFLRLSFGEADTGAPISISGNWKRKWIQAFGPFELFGDGNLSCTVFGKARLLLHTRDDPAILSMEFENPTFNNHVKMNPNSISELPLENPESNYKICNVSIKIIDGQVGILGLCAELDAVPYYIDENSCDKVLRFDL